MAHCAKLCCTSPIPPWLYRDFSSASVPGTHLAAVGGDDAEVGRDPVSSFHLHQVSCHHLLRIDLHLLSLTDHQGLLGEEREQICKDASLETKAYERNITDCRSKKKQCASCDNTVRWPAAS